MKINSSHISDEVSPFLIAEIGINHNGDVSNAIKMAEQAKFCGANAAKLQVFNADSFLSKRSEYFQLFSDLALSEKEYEKIFNRAQQLGFTVFASVFDDYAVELMERLDCPCYKVASGDITHIPLLELVAKTNKPIILSSGGSTLNECHEALDTINNTNNAADVAILHCVSNYPASFDTLNLAVIPNMKQEFRVPIGFSDHTFGSEAATAAVALGANIIEKHFTLNKEQIGPDHSLSADPSELEKIANSIHNSFKSVGSSQKVPVETEEHIVNIRRSITSNQLIPRGEIITREMLSFKRPADGLQPKEIDQIIGKQAKVSIPEDTTIKWDHILK